MKRTILLAVLFLFVAASFLSAVTEVRPGERAVVRRFGRVLDDKPRPGLWIGLPWGIDRVDRVPVDLARRLLVGYQPDAQADSIQTPAGQLLTGDHNLVNVQVALIYSVQEDRVEDYVVQAERVDSLVARAAETALAEWVASRTVDEVLLRGKAALPEWLVRQTQERIAPYQLGIQIREEASVTYLYPPDEVRAAFDDVTRAQTEIRTSRYRAEQEAQRMEREAESEKYRLEQLTAAHAREQRLLAAADAENFERRREQYRRSQTENRAFLAGIWWDEMGKLFTKLKEDGRLDLLDHHIGADGLDITLFPPMGKKK